MPVSQCGVSVIICCHNSSQRISTTLHWLANQQFSEVIPWEILLVDNASTDQTAEIAAREWNNCEVPLRIVSESQLGLSNARQKGIREATYEFLCFVDDDNWVAENWVQNVFTIMNGYPDCGALGGNIQAVFEEEPPDWFARAQETFAVGNQSLEETDITDGRGYLFGAGLTIRKSAWHELMESNFQFLLTDRKGKSLTSGGDVELCEALSIIGWRLYATPQLAMQHFMPRARLNWNYLRNLKRATGASYLVINIYRQVSDGVGFQDQQRDWIKSIWVKVAFRLVLYFIRNAKQLIPWFLREEGNWESLKMEFQIGMFLELLNLNTRYDHIYQSVDKWARTHRSESVKRPD